MNRSAIKCTDLAPFAVANRTALFCRHTMSGLSLVELMVGVALSSFLILGTIQLYVSFKASSRGLEASARLMENGRVAMELLNRSVRLGRYWGCAGVTDNSVTVHLVESTPATEPGMTMQGIYGEEAAGPYGSADAITVYQLEDNSEVSVSDIDDPGNGGANPDPLSATALIEVPEGSGFTDGDYVVINDCTQADVFDLTAVTTSSGNPDKLALANCTSCTHTYTTSASVSRIKRSRFFIGTGASGEPALFVQENGGSNQELIEGVENMQIYYGQDVDDDRTVDRYVTSAVIDADCIAASNTDCWRGVASVRISLLLRTTDTNVTETAQTYSFDGSSATATDGRLRREFITIVSLRNHRL